VRVPDLQPIAAAFAALLLLASVAWWLLSVPEMIDPGMPTWKGADIVSLKADVPKIADFPVFYVNDENPFVPFQLRRDEVTKHDSLRNPGKYAPPPAPPPQPPMKIQPPRPPVVVVETEKPKLVLPKLSPTPANAPLVYGLVAIDGAEALIVRMPNGKDSIRMIPGDKAEGWTLVSIDNGNLATFTDPNGEEQRFSIGKGDLVAAQDGAGGTTTGKTATGKGMVPKPAPNDPALKPPGPKVDGAIPRPPPREERRRPPKEGEKVEPPPKK
jgi:hypothetical protein